MLRTAIVIGGGVGGLAAAVHLARAGVRVRLYEQATTLGGKLAEVTLGGRQFLTGPSMLTMRGVFEDLFGGAAALAAALELQPVDPLCRHFFADRSQLDLYSDVERSRAAIAAFASARDADGYLAFRRHAEKIYQAVRGPFMERPLALPELLNPLMLKRFTQIDGLRTLWKAVASFFVDPRLRQLFARYATYTGSSPFHAPGTLAVVAHVENEYGIFTCRGGLYRLAEALEQLLRTLGGEIELGVAVDEIVVERDRAVGVRRQGRAGVERADVVVANGDAATVYGSLLPGSRVARKAGAKYAAEELSLSAYVLLAVAERAPIALLPHNVFFSGDYAREFDELVERRRPPSDPTVYVRADDRGEPQYTLSERVVLVTNAPPLDERGRHIDWSAEAPRCRQRIERTLAGHGWTLKTEHSQAQTPVDFAARFLGSKGAIYGLASNAKLAAFKRPAHRVAGIERLYLCGGTTHPGAGLPMVCLSAKMAATMALEDLR